MIRRQEIKLTGPAGPCRLAALMLTQRRYIVIGIPPTAKPPERGHAVDNVWGYRLGIRFTVTQETEWGDWFEQASAAKDAGLFPPEAAITLWPDGSKFFRVVPERMSNTEQTLIR